MGRVGTIGIVLIALALLVSRVRAGVDRYEVSAVRFATPANLPFSILAAGADRSRRMDTATIIWVLKGIDGRIAIVVDSGFHRVSYFTQFTVAVFTRCPRISDPAIVLRYQ